MSYIAVTLNHFRAIQEWAQARQAQARLDMKTFHLEVAMHAGRCTLHPQFFNSGANGMSYSSHLTPVASGFIGWLPYRPIRWDLSTDKLKFRQFLDHHGLRAPRVWSAGEAIDADHVLKLAQGSFGRDIFGPYRAGLDVRARPDIAAHAARGMFAQQFVAGRNVKVWFWGAQAFHLHLDSYPTICGDGVSTIASLVSAGMGAAGTRASAGDKASVDACIAFHRRTASEVLPAGETIWFEYRYGRRYPDDPIQSEPDSALAQVAPAVRAQIDAAGARLHAELNARHGLPVLFALDAVLDEHGDLWWLEANSNPILPPTGYPLILATLFDGAHLGPAAASLPAPSPVPATTRPEPQPVP